MAYLSQASSPIADFSKCVITFLARVPAATAAAGSGGFFEFGDPSRLSAATMLPDGSIVDGFEGPADYKFTLNGTESGEFEISCNSPPTGEIPSDTDTWHRIIMSIDVSGSASWTYTPPAGIGHPAFFTFVNNDFRFWLSVDDVDYSATSFDPPAEATPPTGSISGPAGIFFPSLGGLHTSFDEGDANFPGFTINLNGLEFSMPCLAANADPSYNGRFQIADFLMWTGVSLDTSVSGNRRLFIDASGNEVNPSVAIDALGTPVYDFRGHPADFVNNRGSGGSFTSTGIIGDFTPGP